MFGFIYFFFFFFPQHNPFLFIYFYSTISIVMNIFSLLFWRLLPFGISHRLTTTSSMSPSERVKNQKEGGNRGYCCCCLICYLLFSSFILFFIFIFFPSPLASQCRNMAVILDTKCLSIKHFCAIGGPRPSFLPPLYQNN